MTPARRQLGSLIGFGCLALAVVIAALWNGAGSADASGSGELVAQPSPGAPAETFLGASPLEASGEVWATARNQPTLARYTNAGGWETVPPPVAAEGGPISELGLASGASAGRTTPRGGIVMAATAGGELGEHPIVLVRDPGGPLRETSDPSAVLKPGESLLPEEAPLVAAQEAAGNTRAYVVPTRARKGILDFVAGAGWTREPVCAGFISAVCEEPSENFAVVGIDAGGGEAWLLGREAAEGEGIELFRREPNGGPGGEAVWRQQALGPPGSTGALYQESDALGVEVSARRQGQPLTVTDTGVWADAVLADGGQNHDATIYYDIAAGQVTGSWCDLASQLCQYPLGAELPAGEGRSFAWAAGGPYGRRTITGVGQGAILNLEGESFARIALAGGDAGGRRGAALSAPDEGWLGDRPPLQLTRNPETARLQSWPVPFRRPLLAITGEPGAATGSLGSEAIAVGTLGQVARYVPGEGWEPEPLLRSSGTRATPTLRGVAWPQPGRAYAVGDNNAMWLWQKSTGLWEPDPGAPRNLARANFTGIAFDPDRPNRGYAIGKQGLLLSFGREWIQEPLPSGVPAEANFTSIAFSGDEALATYKFPVLRGSTETYTGGVIVNDGSGWRLDQPAETTLKAAVPQLVAGLPDGGAIIVTLEEGEAGVTESAVISRQSAGAAWARAAGQLNGFPVSLDAVLEAGQVRGIASIAEFSQDLSVDREQIFNRPPPGQAPLLTDPYPLPGGGLVVRQTATGWRDEQHELFPEPAHVEGQNEVDLSYRPDPVLALLISPGGGEGWAVGGESGSFVATNGQAIQTAGVMRYGPGAAPPSNASASPVLVEPQMVNFAVAGGAGCVGPCADLTGTGIGPDRWLKAAVGRAAGIPGLRAFLYTGPGVARGSASSLSPLAFGREEKGYSRRLGSAAGSLPAFATPSQSDLDGSGSLSTFAAAFAGYGSPLGTAPPGSGIAPVSQASAGQAFYSFNSVGPRGTIRVAVLDYSSPKKTLAQAQRCWLASELAAAKAGGIPAVVVGSRDLSHRAPDAADDGSEIARILVGIPPPECSAAPAAASAYFFEYPEQNRAFRLNAGGRSIPAIGSGTLGYVHPPLAAETDFVGASGFLLASVNADPSAREQSTNMAPVSVRLIPNIGSLAIDPTDGTLIRRSHQALFQGLARRPLAGSRCSGNDAPSSCDRKDPEPYVPIPNQCQGSKCATGIFPEYTFTSSNPDIADFVAPDPGSLNARTVYLVHEKPVLDPHSGLLCAFNAGTTVVTLSTGGLAYSQKVTVLDGTAQRPCGTTPLRNRRTITTPVSASPPPAPAPEPGFNPGTTSFPPVPPPALPALAPNPPTPNPTPNPPPPAILPFLPLSPQPPSLPVAIAPPPPPPLPQVTPPSGTSEVTQEEEEEEVEHSVVHHMVTSSPEYRLTPVALPALAVLMAIAGAGIFGPGTRRRHRARLAYESNTDPRRHR